MINLYCLSSKYLYEFLIYYYRTREPWNKSRNAQKANGCNSKENYKGTIAIFPNPARCKDFCHVCPGPLADGRRVLFCAVVWPFFACLSSLFYFRVKLTCLITTSIGRRFHIQQKTLNRVRISRSIFTNRIINTCRKILAADPNMCQRARCTLRNGIDSARLLRRSL